MDCQHPVVSVIIPVYNEEKALPATLDQFHHQSGAFEIIAVDGGSADRSCDIVAQYPGIHLLRAPKGRASQMNAGARLARGEWLLFLHADTRLPPGALRRLGELQTASTCLAGGFRHRFSGSDWRLRLISMLDNYRCQRTRVIYGDQAMFVRRTLFHQLGGFPNCPVLEDVTFCHNLNAVTEPILLDEYVLTDSQKFVNRGIWRGLARVFGIFIRLELGRPVATPRPDSHKACEYPVERTR